MAPGKHHDRADLIMASLLAATAIALQSPAALYTAAGTALHLYLSPDLDLPRCNARRRWGWIGFIWEPYERLIPHHRHWSSHCPGIGTAIRISPLMIWWLWVQRDRAIDALTGWDWIGLLQVFPEWSLWVFTGLCLGDALHLSMDWLWSEASKIRRRF